MIEVTEIIASSGQQNAMTDVLVIIERAKQCLIKVLLFRCRRPVKNVSFFFIYEYTSLKLALLMYYEILRNISGLVILKKLYFLSYRH